MNKEERSTDYPYGVTSFNGDLFVMEHTAAQMYAEIQQLKEVAIGYLKTIKDLRRQLESKGATQQQIADAWDAAMAWQRLARGIPGQKKVPNKSSYLSRFNGGAAPQETDKK
jgi:hypothetical protein